MKSLSFWLYRLVLPIFFLPFIYACVEIYEPSLTLSTEVLIVDGTLTDGNEDQVISISRSRVFNSGYTTTVPVKGAIVQVETGNGGLVNFTETTTGFYQGPSGFRGQIGQKYKLHFQLTTGQKYESSEEIMPTGTTIGNVYDHFDASGIINTDKSQIVPANLVYIDTSDPPGERNFYRWRWTLWEQQSWCTTCQQGMFAVTDTNTSDGTCLKVTSLARDNFFDYNCAGACWEILQNNDFNLFSDTYSNGRPIIGKLAAKIPFYQALPALVEIQQYSITAGAYQYYRIFEGQSQNNGGLADTPPSPTIGNIRNLADENEPVVGYFSASPVSKTRYWLSRDNSKGTPVGLFETQMGRSPNVEPSDTLPAPFLIRPPGARCLPSATRTPIRPAGWRG